LNPSALHLLQLALRPLLLKRYRFPLLLLLALPQSTLHLHNKGLHHGNDQWIFEACKQQRSFACAQGAILCSSGCNA
jgi:hypothetical protein